MADIKFPDGISVFAKNANVPEYVGDSIVIDTPKLIAWLQSQPMKVKLQIATSKAGKKYLKVDDRQPSTGQQPQAQVSYERPVVSTPVPARTETIVITPIDENLDLPF